MSLLYGTFYIGKLIAFRELGSNFVHSSGSIYPFDGLSKSRQRKILIRVRKCYLVYLDKSLKISYQDVVNSIRNIEKKERYDLRSNV